MAFEHSTKMPSNVNDEDINPQNVQQVTERLGGTEMTFCLISHEVSGVVRSLNYVPHKDAHVLERKDREELIKEYTRRIDSRFLVHCDLTIPIFWVCSTVSRLIIQKGWLFLQYPYQTHLMASRSEATRESTLSTAVSILEISDMLETNEATAKWAWFFATYVQWHPLAVALAELCVQTSGPLVERAWTIVDVVFDKWSERIADSKKGTLWRPIKKLLGKARTARSQFATQVEGQAVPAPDMQYLPDRDVGHPYTAPDSLQSGVRHEAAPAVATEPLDHLEAFLFPEPQIGLDEYVPADLISNMNLDQPTNTINWLDWDEFIESTWQAGEPAQESGNMQWAAQFGF